MNEQVSEENRVGKGREKSKEKDGKEEYEEGEKVMNF